MKTKREVQVKNFGSVDREAIYLVSIGSYERFGNDEMELMEGSFWDIVEYFRDVYCDEDKSLGVDDILKIVDSDGEDSKRIFVK
jgi:hypothetical protein